jgi:hypothetical protein
MIDVDMNEGMLIHDSDHKGDAVETDHVTITGHVEQPTISEENKRVLRDQLRKTLNQSRLVNISPHPERDAYGMHESFVNPGIAIALEYRDRSYFVLTEAGKPVFVEPKVPIARRL